MLGLGVGVLAKLLWDALNRRGTPSEVPITEPTYFALSDGVDVNFIIKYDQGGSQGPSVGCNPPYYTGNGYPFSGGPLSISQFGVGLTIGPATWTQTFVCGGSGYSETDAAPYITLHRANGGVFVLANTPGSIIYFASSDSRVLTNTRKNLRVERNGVDTPLVLVVPGSLPPGVGPTIPVPAPAVAASPAPTIAPASAPLPLPAAVPGAAPVPAPTPGPGGLPAGQPATPPDAATVPNLVRTVTTSSPGSQTQPITAGGVSQAPAAPIVPTTPAEAVLIGSQLVGGPGSTPPQGPGGTAAELGRLEGKSELALSKLGQLAPLLESIDVLQALGEWLLSANGGVTYTLQPPCGTDANGDPLPPVEVVVPPTIGVEVATIARLDALAMLIDEHKQMRQPICKGKPTGSPVTVTAVEVE